MDKTLFSRKTKELFMKNKIKEVRAKELKAKQEADAAAARKAELDAIKSKNILDSMDEIANGEVRVYRDEDGTAKATNGGEYIQVPVNGSIIAAKTQEEINAIKERIERGITGDGLLHKTVMINGKSCDCVGATEEELEADIKAAENYAKAHGANILRDPDIGEQLVDAEYARDDLEQIEINGRTYVLCYSGKYIMDLQGNTLVSLDDIKEKLGRESIKIILIDRLSKR